MVNFQIRFLFFPVRFLLFTTCKGSFHFTRYYLRYPRSYDFGTPVKPALSEIYYRRGLLLEKTRTVNCRRREELNWRILCSSTLVPLPLLFRVSFLFIERDEPIPPMDNLACTFERITNLISTLSYSFWFFHTHKINSMI